MTTDATGREIREGDLLRAKHFIGARRKQHYRYFVVFESIGGLRAVQPHALFKTTGFPLEQVMRDHPDATIIDGYACKDGEVSFEDRPRHKEQA